MLARFWKLKDWLQHALIAAGWMAVFGLPWWALGWSHPAIVGAIAGVMFFYGREQRDTENADPALYDNPKSLMFWKWRRDQRTDFIAPLIGNGGLAVLFEVLL
jgi:hypothetical protein